MCGIVGQFSVNQPIDQKSFWEMRDTLAHRGPDDAGVYFGLKNHLALGHRRLSIIDLSEAGRQPMANEDESIWLVCNSEIYNYKELRKELLLKGHKFKSKCDSEVIIHAYEEWGTEAWQKFIGMFAFALWDSRKEELYLARDRIGIKPLYYFLKNGNFVFASEIKAILKSAVYQKAVNPEALRDFLIYRYVATPRTIWKDVFKVKPGTFLKFKNGKIEERRYWKLEPCEIDIYEKEALETIEKLLFESVSLRMRSDVPVGIFLSGGIDSSAVCAYARKHSENVNTYSIDIRPEKFSERKYADLVAQYLKTNHFVREVDLKASQDVLEKVISIFDEPLADSSIFPTYLLSRYTSQHVKVALSGDGGDEVFAGYKWYTNFLKLLKLPPFLRAFLSVGGCLLPLKLAQQYPFNVLKMLSSEPLEMYRRVVLNRFTIDEVKRLFNLDIPYEVKNTYVLEPFVSNNRINIKTLQYIDLNTYLRDDILVKVDMTSMANSLEVRVPLLDHKLVEFVFSLPPSLIYKNEELKYLLKRVASPLLPEETVKRKKRGFSVPLTEWRFNERYKPLLNDSYLVREGILNKEKLASYLKDGFPEDKLWMLILLELWFRKWFVST